MISGPDGMKLIKLARDSITLHFSSKHPDTKDVLKFSDKQGVFVTLHKDGELRGCIGFPEPIFPLYEAIMKASLAAGFDDPRFIPLTEDELEKCKIEVSVLSVPVEVTVKDPKEYQDKIKVGRDGLIIRSGFQSGLLLPQVPVEQHWDLLQYLEYIGIKAGMDKEAYKNPDNKLFSFQAQIFSE